MPLCFKHLPNETAQVLLTCGHHVLTNDINRAFVFALTNMSVRYIYSMCEFHIYKSNNEYKYYIERVCADVDLSTIHFLCRHCFATRDEAVARVRQALQREGKSQQI